MHDHEHTHDTAAAHVHAHPHGDQKAMSPEETLALLNYMLDHNRHHADELHDICHSLEANGKSEAAEKLPAGRRRCCQSSTGSRVMRQIEPTVQ